MRARLRGTRTVAALVVATAALVLPQTAADEITEVFDGDVT